MARFNNPLKPEKREAREPTYNMRVSELHAMTKRGVLDGMAAGTYICNAMYSAAMLMVLHDTLGFGQKRLERIFTRVQKMLGEIMEKRISYADLCETIREEVKVNLVVEKPDGVRQDALDLFRELEAPGKIEMVFNKRR